MVYIIVVNYNNYSDTIECIETLLKSTYAHYQILIVDNSVNESSISEFFKWANDADYEGIKTSFQHLVKPLINKPLSFKIVSESDFSNSADVFDERVIIIRSENHGFAAANNIVLKYILKNADSSSLIWLLNNDTVLEKNTLSKLVTAYEKSPDSKYIYASKLKYYYKPDTIQAVAGSYNKWLGKHYHIGELQLDNGQYDNYLFEALDYPVGASIFLPKLFIDEVGIMCEDYFLYFEELDWMVKGAKHGFKTVLVPDAVVYHKEGASIIGLDDGRKNTSLAEYYSITNRVRFIKKWYPLCLLTVLPGVFWALTKRVVSGKHKLAKKASRSVIRILFSNKSAPLKYEES